jgi:hypothetical protein
MAISKLVEKFESVCGEKCRSRNKRYLIRSCVRGRVPSGKGQTDPIGTLSTSNTDTKMESLSVCLVSFRSP